MKRSAEQQMDSLSQDVLHMVIGLHAYPCISLFLPIDHTDPTQRQNTTRLTNLIRQAEARMITSGYTLELAQEVLAPARKLIDNRTFWANQSNSLVIYLAPHLFHLYRLPVAFEPLAVVDSHVYITPLLPLLRDDEEFYLLALHLEGVELFYGTRFGLYAVVLPNVPASLEATLESYEFGKSAQFHPGQGRDRGTVFYSQGARDETAAKQEILRYFQLVDHGVHHVLRNSEAPLVLAGTAYLLPIYREANSYPHLINEGITVNVADMRSDTLHAEAWALVAPDFDQARLEAAERFRMKAGSTPPTTSVYLRAIIPAAFTGRIETLFVSLGQQQWGMFDPTSGALQLHDPAAANDSELINLAVIQTLKHGGAVYGVMPEQMPSADPLAAIFRY